MGREPICTWLDIKGGGLIRNTFVYNAILQDNLQENTHEWKDWETQPIHLFYGEAQVNHTLRSWLAEEDVISYWSDLHLHFSLTEQCESLADCKIHGRWFSLSPSPPLLLWILYISGQLRLTKVWMDFAWRHTTKCRRRRLHYSIAYSITNLSVGSLTADNSRNPSQGGCAINQRNYLVEQVSQSVEYPNEVTASVISVGRVCGFEQTLAVISPVPRITILDIPRTTAQQNNFARD